MWYLFVLSLFWIVVGINSQSVPYVSFMGTNLPNHSYVELSVVGDDISGSIQCHTDLTSCCGGGQGPHRGDWYLPDGDRLPFPGNGYIYEARGDQQVDVHRRNDANSPSGIYRCDIPTNDGDISERETVYVGVYASGGDIVISSLTVISDLDGPTPQFTLTCISTGGPSTTVTWTRDCVTATEGTDTVLDDPVTAQYTYTLTVTGRLEGIYIYVCTVANDKPSSDSASYPAQEHIIPVMSVTIGAVNATAVRVSWTGSYYHSTSLQYISYFTATGSVMSQHETVLSPGVTSTVVTLDDAVDGYEHNFTLQYAICGAIESPVTTSTFAFDKKHFQIQFGPFEYCLNWIKKKILYIKKELHRIIVRIIRECCPHCNGFTAAYLRMGAFLCHSDPTVVTYRSTLINPFPITNSTYLVAIIQSWVSTSTSLIIDYLVARVISSCPTQIASLYDDECVGSVQSDSAVGERISQVLSVCAVRELGQQICTI